MMKRIIGTVVVAVLLLTAGYVLAAQQVVMDIKGMTCELCSIVIKMSLEKVAGVKSVKVSFEDKKARLAVDDAVTDKTLEEAVRNAGGGTLEKSSRGNMSAEPVPGSSRNHFG